MLFRPAITLADNYQAENLHSLYIQCKTLILFKTVWEFSNISETFAFSLVFLQYLCIFLEVEWDRTASKGIFPLKGIFCLPQVFFSSRYKSTHKTHSNDCPCKITSLYLHKYCMHAHTHDFQLYVRRNLSKDWKSICSLSASKLSLRVLE